MYISPLKYRNACASSGCSNFLISTCIVENYCCLKLLLIHCVVDCFRSAPSRSNSVPTCSTCCPSAAVSPTAHCGSPPPLWRTAPWRPCSSAFSPSETCMSARVKGDDGSRPIIRKIYSKTVRRRSECTSDKWPFFNVRSRQVKRLYTENVHSKHSPNKEKWTKQISRIDDVLKRVCKKLLIIFWPISCLETDQL